MTAVGGTEPKGVSAPCCSQSTGWRDGRRPEPPGKRAPRKQVPLAERRRGDQGRHWGLRRRTRSRLWLDESRGARPGPPLGAERWRRGDAGGRRREEQLRDPQARAAGRDSLGLRAGAAVAPRPGLARTAEQLLGLLQDGGHLLALPGYLGRNGGQGVVLEPLQGDCTGDLLVGLARSSLPPERRA